VFHFTNTAIWKSEGHWDNVSLIALNRDPQDCTAFPLVDPMPEYPWKPADVSDAAVFYMPLRAERVVSRTKNTIFDPIGMDLLLKVFKESVHVDNLLLLNHVYRVRLLDVSPDGQSCTCVRDVDLSSGSPQTSPFISMRREYFARLENIKPFEHVVPNFKVTEDGDSWDMWAASFLHIAAYTVRDGTEPLVQAVPTQLAANLKRPTDDDRCILACGLPLSIESPLLCHASSAWQLDSCRTNIEWKLTRDKDWNAMYVQRLVSCYCRYFLPAIAGFIDEKCPWPLHHFSDLKNAPPSTQTIAEDVVKFIMTGGVVPQVIGDRSPLRRRVEAKFIDALPPVFPIHSIRSKDAATPSKPVSFVQVCVVPRGQTGAFLEEIYARIIASISMNADR